MKEFTKIEYAEAAHAARHFGNMRFATLGLLSAMNGAALLNIERLSNVSFALPFPIVVIAVTACFWILDESATRYWRRAVARLAEIEAGEGGAHYLRPRSNPVFSATWATRVLYWGAILSWLAVLL
ncbi:MAG: hypothetical protein AAF311_17795 [Pseudomonadota bacterium]